MKYKYEDLDRVMKQLARHSQKGDIEIHIDTHTKALTFDYVSNVHTDTTIEVQPTENNGFVTINEKKWLKD